MYVLCFSLRVYVCLSISSSTCVRIHQKLFRSIQVSILPYIYVHIHVLGHTYITKHARLYADLRPTRLKIHHEKAKSVHKKPSHAHTKDSHLAVTGRKQNVTLAFLESFCLLQERLHECLHQRRWSCAVMCVCVYVCVYQSIEIRSPRCLHTRTLHQKHHEPLLPCQGIYVAPYALTHTNTLSTEGCINT